LFAAFWLAAGPVLGQACQANSRPTVTPVLELYTSEGCSSCPPADRWLSGLKPAAAAGDVVVQAFHVGYWDYIGWVDRFANATHTARQRELAALNGLRGIYTPQLVRSGRDWPDWDRQGPSWKPAAAAAVPAGAAIQLRRQAGDAFEAVVTPAQPAGAWAAYWTVTEHGHASKVARGENAGSSLRHDFVVRQYVPVGSYKGPAKLSLQAVAADSAHARQVNLVVFDPRTGAPLQALSLSCA